MFIIDLFSLPVDFINQHQLLKRYKIPIKNYFKRHYEHFSSKNLAMIPGLFPNDTSLYILDLIVTILSLCGSLFMIYSCLKLPSSKSVSIRLILGIASADFLYSISNAISNFESDSPITENLCMIEATIRHNSFFLSIFFATCTAIVSYKASDRENKFDKDEFFSSAIIIAIFVGIFLTIL